VDKSEDNLIAWIASRFPTGDLPIGIGDDMAMLPTSEAGILVTADMLMDGVDFDTAVHTPEQIGRKALAVSLSDCAAMAVRPRWALVSVALPNSWSLEMAQRLYLGMEPLAQKYNCRIIGGDTNSWDKPLVIDVMVVAEPWPNVLPIRRDGMQPGDCIWVTGSLGGSLSGHHLTFEPRVAEARELTRRLGAALHAMIDLSDGLSIDANRMARVSKCGVEFDEPSLRSVAADAAREASSRDNRAELDHVLNDGEDFELLLAVDPTFQAGLVHPRTCTRIGMVVSEPGLWLRRADDLKEPIQPRGWQHFQPRADPPVADTDK